MRRLVIDEFRRTGVGQASSRIKADEIGARGRTERCDQAVSSRNKEQKAADLDREQDPAIRDDAAVVQRIAQRAVKTQPRRYHRSPTSVWMTRTNSERLSASL